MLDHLQTSIRLRVFNVPKEASTFSFISLSLPNSFLPAQGFKVQNRASTPRQRRHLNIQDPREPTIQRVPKVRKVVSTLKLPDPLTKE